jgi:site-specific recombinase
MVRVIEDRGNLADMIDEAIATSGDFPPGERFPDAAELHRVLGATEGKAIPRLHAILVAFDPDASLADQRVSIEQLGRYIIAGPAIDTTGHEALARLRLLVETLEQLPVARTRFQGVLRSVLSQTRAIKLLGEIGLPNDRGLLAETTDRLAKRFLPQVPEPHELWRLAASIVHRIDDIEWLGPAADPLLQRMAEVGGDAWEPLRTSVNDAISMIATRIAAAGMAEQFRTRTAVSGVRDSPLYHLTHARPQDMPGLIDAARHHLTQVHHALEETGVSIDVVYSLDAIERGLARIELLLPFADRDDAIEPTFEIRALLGAVGRGLVGARSFRQLLSDNLRMLARKVIERAGKTAEQYVTSSRREYWKMLASAAGGGVLAFGAAVARFFVKWGHWPLFIDGLQSSLVYAGSLVLMQLLGLTFASKQPPMTATALASTIRTRSGAERFDELVPLIARIARSQFAATIGNVLTVVVCALAFDVLVRRVSGQPFLDARTSRETLASLHPFGSGTMVFAALTGVLLWLSSLAAGWFENWIVYRRLPEAIEHHRYAGRVGHARMVKLARFVETEAAGFGGSVSLGLLLGMMPVFSKFFGLPLDVRHVALSSGALTMSVSSLGIDGAGWGPLIWAAVGVAIIGFVTFLVSFGLAVVVALRARDVPGVERRTLPLAVMRHFVKHPFQYFLPPR